MPGSMPELWDITMKDLPEVLVGKGDNPSYGEWAVYTTLTLFALHQQGKDLKSQCMNQDGMSLGIAVRNLIQTSEDENRVKRRFDAAATSDSVEEFSHHLRGLIQLLKAENIPLDYPKLTEDLYRFQFPEARDNVRLQWGREFYSMLKKI
jgi:CRISPR system Cascade subunit CasB